MTAASYFDPLAREPEFVETTTLSGGGARGRILWPAIFGGEILVIAVQLLLSMLGAGIGLGTGNVNAGSTPDASLNADHEVTEEVIRERAYLLWEQAGRPEGHADDFWHKAQTQILGIE